MIAYCSWSPDFHLEPRPRSQVMITVAGNEAMLLTICVHEHTHIGVMHGNLGTRLVLLLAHSFLITTGLELRYRGASPKFPEVAHEALA